MAFLQRIQRNNQEVPLEYRRNFFHFYMEIGWWGLLNGSILVFLAIYASRLGATTAQLGLLTASPAVMNMLFTFPSGAVLQRLPTAQATRWSALIGRLFYLFLIPLPVFLLPGAQIWVIIGITLAMNLPGTLNAIVFNAFLAEAVPENYRGQVVGVRNAVLAGTTLLTTLVVGQILERLPFTLGYQIVFIIGFIGAMMSVLHLWMIKLPSVPAKLPTRELDPQTGEELAVAVRVPLRAALLQSVRMDVIKSSYGSLLLLIFVFQVGVYLINPIVPRYQIDHLLLSDAGISIGSALFQVTSLVASLQTRKYAALWGFKRMTAYGILIVSLTLVMFTFGYEIWFYWMHQVLGGVGWAFVNSGLINHVLEKVPVDDRASYLTWYNLANNAAILLCGFTAPLISDLIGMIPTLMVAVCLRILVGGLLLKKVARPQPDGLGVILSESSPTR